MWLIMCCLKLLPFHVHLWKKLMPRCTKNVTTQIQHLPVHRTHTQRKSLFIQCASRDIQNFKAAVNFTAESNTIAPLDTQTNTNKTDQTKQRKQNNPKQTKHNTTNKTKQNKQTPLCDTLSRCSHHFTMASMNTRAAAF